MVSVALALKVGVKLALGVRVSLTVRVGVAESVGVSDSVAVALSVEVELGVLQSDNFTAPSDHALPTGGQLLLVGADRDEGPVKIPIEFVTLHLAVEE